MLIRNGSVTLPRVFSCNFLYAHAMLSGAWLCVGSQHTIVNVFRGLSFNFLYYLSSGFSGYGSIKMNVWVDFCRLVIRPRYTSRGKLEKTIWSYFSKWGLSEDKMKLVPGRLVEFFIKQASALIKAQTSELRFFCTGNPDRWTLGQQIPAACETIGKR